MRHWKLGLRGRRAGLLIGAVLSLGFAMGAAVAVYSVIDAVLLRPLPYPHQEELMRISREQGPQRIGPPVSGPAYLDLARAQKVFAQFVALSNLSFVVGAAGGAERENGVRVSGQYFDMMGLPTALGRAIAPSDDNPAAQRVAVLSHAYWREHFASDPGVLGRAMTLNGEAYTVIGVADAKLNFPGQAGIAVPLRLEGEGGNRGNNMLILRGRLAPGVSMAQAQEQMSALAQRLAQAHPDNHAELDLRVQSVVSALRDPARDVLNVIGAAIALLILVGCASLANLLLADVLARRREFATRGALGATPGTLVRDYLIEAAGLVGIATVLGLAFGALALQWLLAQAPVWIPRVEDVRLSWTAVAAVVVTALLVSAICGLAPARQAARVDAGDALRGGARSGATDTARGNVRRVLVAAQIGLCLVLLIGAGLLGESLRRLLREDPGFPVEGLVTAAVTLAPDMLPSGADAERDRQAQQRAAAFMRRAVERIEALPGVAHAAFAMRMPFVDGAGFNGDFYVQGDAEPASGTAPLVEYQAVTPSYFETMGLPLLAGEAFDPNAQPEEITRVLINDAMAQQHFATRNPVGMALMVGDAMPIRGVVRGARQNGLGERARPELYLSYYEAPAFWPDSNIVIRSASAPETLMPAVRRTIAELAPDVPIYGMQTLSDALARTHAQREFLLTVFRFFALTALAIAVVGLYGVLSHAVTQRRAELGVRMALGADRARVLALISRDGAAMLATGVVGGVIAAALSAHWLSSRLYALSPWNPWVYAAVVGVLVLVAGVGVLLPAWRAARVSPMAALRSD
jgi:predicted permease